MPLMITEARQKALRATSPMASQLPACLEPSATSQATTTEGKSVFLLPTVALTIVIWETTRLWQTSCTQPKRHPLSVMAMPDIKFAEETEASYIPSVSMHCTWSNISSLHSITPMALSSFELTLDSGESRIMRPGDVSIQRATSHKWKNITGNGTMPVECFGCFFHA
ncbi:unnamed protein product [Clonostachys rosea f. rosea IK726]|uniref:Uncharacterized protein n=1 Tax=Clonostachys rosea f. rosea IK726 TaxID=1349383 RepID=A0ACA9U8A5_BIOOC|nr:unnamed protein product [Clonostachys rosea f. rosea IK726]